MVQGHDDFLKATSKLDFINGTIFMPSKTNKPDEYALWKKNQ
jgi:hypothetical protein